MCGRLGVTSYTRASNTDYHVRLTAESIFVFIEYKEQVEQVSY